MGRWATHPVRVALGRGRRASRAGRRGTLRGGARGRGSSGAHVVRVRGARARSNGAATHRLARLATDTRIPSHAGVFKKTPTASRGNVSTPFPEWATTHSTRARRDRSPDVDASKRGARRAARAFCAPVELAQPHDPRFLPPHARDPARVRRSESGVRRRKVDRAPWAGAPWAAAPRWSRNPAS